ncbi:MAG: tannase/feruloyl esterase family alpha/beta hydrolase [Gammaproteobacteria bacterium]|nr:tannase/feruloyl esterase family alpha/beta hydrolase [Gammaproteobacteria bacterium]
MIRVALLVALLSPAAFGQAGDSALPPGAEECAVLAAIDFAEAASASVALRASFVAASGDLPARCAVSGNIGPETGFEAWLPLENWNGRLLATGCHNLCGKVQTEQMEDAAARGYATVTMDGGHSEKKYPDSRWALDNTALEDEFGHQALHRATLLAKALVRAFYGDEANYSYFRGCSTGGRQALAAVERYPEDYDGVIAGAPFDQRHSVPHMIWADRANTGADGRPVLRAAQYALLARKVLEACDSADGLADSVVGDPERCSFDPATLACAADATGTDCLDAQQLRAVGLIYQGPADGKGRLLVPSGAARGSEFTWERQLTPRDGRPPYFRFIGENWLRFHAFEPDPAAGAAPVFDFDRDPRRLAASAARMGYTPALERYAERDGRLIVHHGWADESLQPAHTLGYWREALRLNGGSASLQSFARLFMLPGVMHCGGGPGAGDVDWLTAIERWVEADDAPDALIATRTKDSGPTLGGQPRFPVAGEVLARRPVFPYPDVARYRGEGDPLDPASYERQPPAAQAD